MHKGPANDGRAFFAFKGPHPPISEHMSNKILNQAERDLANRRLQADIQTGHETTRQILAWRRGAVAAHHAAAAEAAKERKRRRNRWAPLSLILIIAGIWAWYTIV